MQQVFYLLQFSHQEQLHRQIMSNTMCLVTQHVRRPIPFVLRLRASLRPAADPLFKAIVEGGRYGVLIEVLADKDNLLHAVAVFVVPIAGEFRLAG